MAAADVRSVDDWSDAGIISSEMVRSCSGVSSLLLKQSIRLSALEEDSILVILQPFWLCAFVRSVIACTDSSVASSDRRLARDSA